MYPYRRSTIVSLETNPNTLVYLFQNAAACNLCVNQVRYCSCFNHKTADLVEILKESVPKI